ncbi:MAG: hypothetical protein P8P99_00335 [Maricaulis sp.]|jgi:hypothetical protein|nr:hypothetical protein [Maricaulis sp.]
MSTFDCNNTLHEPTAQFHVENMDNCLAYYGFTPVASHQVGTFHTLADQLIPGKIARIKTLQEVQSLTECSLHMRTRRAGVTIKPDAILASIRLTDEGRRAVLDGRFGFDDADPGWICHPGQACIALLSWGMAGRTGSAQSVTLRALMASWKQFYATTPVLARGRSESGQKLLSRLGFVPTPISEAVSASSSGVDVPTYVCAQYPSRFDATGECGDVERNIERAA